VEISEWFSLGRQLLFRMARRMARRTARSCRLARRIACGIACGIARGVVVSEGPSASRPTLPSDDYRVMLTDEWLHRSMRKAPVWAVALAGRPLYAEDTIVCVVVE